MLNLILSIVMIGAHPPDPVKAAAHALKRHDYRIAGVADFWGSAKLQKDNWRPYGLICRQVPDDVYSYGYFVSDAIGADAGDGYLKQRRFLISFNNAMLKSGKLPSDWGCAKDLHPGEL